MPATMPATSRHLECPAPFHDSLESVNAPAVSWFPVGCGLRHAYSERAFCIGDDLDAMEGYVSVQDDVREPVHHHQNVGDWVLWQGAGPTLEGRLLLEEWIRLRPAHLSIVFLRGHLLVLLSQRERTKNNLAGRAFAQMVVSQHVRSGLFLHWW